MEKIINSVSENIRELGLVEPGDQILVAFSGGPDSTALLHILHKLSIKLKFSLCACYINHKIRPRAAKKEEQFCRQFCNEYKTAFISVTTDIPKYSTENKMSLEEAGHFRRKELLLHTAEEHNCNKIALGHHRDDIIETILFRLFRGTGPGGLQPMKPKSGRFIRPLFDLSRQEILLYLKRNRLPYMIDHSNLKSAFSRNYIRNRVIPDIEKHFGSKFRPAIINFSRLLAAENDFLSATADKELKKIHHTTPGGKIVVDLDKIGAYPLWLRRRLIKMILERLTGRPGSGGFDEIERVNKIITGQKKAVDLSGNIRVRREKEAIYFVRGKTTVRQRAMKSSGKIEIDELNMLMQYGEISPKRAIRKIQKNGFKINIDSERISLPLTFRGLNAGDRFSPLGMTGTKKVGDYLTDCKTPRVLRDEIPVVTDRNGIVWLVGYQISDRVKVDKSTKKVLQIEVFKRKAGRKAKV